MTKGIKKIAIICNLLALLCVSVFVFSACEGDESNYTVTYECNISGGGYILGETEQTVTAGENCTEVEALALEGYIFTEWSDGVTTAKRADSGVSESATYVAKFEKGYTVSFNCDERMGTITGEANQKVKLGDTTTEVTATPALGYEFVTWSNGEKTQTISVSPDSNQSIYAIMRIQELELPVFSIETENEQGIDSKEVYVNCSVSVSNTDYSYRFNNYSAKIRGRGNTTWEMPKRPYKLKFEKKVDLFGNGAAKTWTLIANYSDPSMLRNYISYMIGQNLEYQKYTTTVQFVDVYLNGQYDGVYLICEQTEVGKTRVDIEDSLVNVDTGYLLELDGRIVEEGDEGIDYFYIDGTPYAIKDPDVDDEGFTLDHFEFIKQYITDSIAALDSGDYSNVLEYLDINTFADAYIVHELIKSADVGQSSFYMYKDAGQKLCAGPLWDFDTSSGNCFYFLDSLRTDYLWSKEKNLWYNKLLNYDEFNELVATKLAQYNSIIRDTIAGSITYANSCKNSILRNFDRWQTLGQNIWPNTEEMIAIKTWEGQVEYLENWLLASLDFLLGEYIVSA